MLKLWINLKKLLCKDFFRFSFNNKLLYTIKLLTFIIIIQIQQIQFLAALLYWVRKLEKLDTVKVGD